MNESLSKRERGQYFTVHNPFKHRAFSKWASDAGLPDSLMLEPFAGNCDIVQHLDELELVGDYDAYDIEPRRAGVCRRDTMASFPSGYDVCITNPPWLGKSQARFLGLPFPKSRHDDLYKICLELSLAACPWVAMLLPESFIRTGAFTGRLSAFVSIKDRVFEDTDHPVGLAMFGPNETSDAVVYAGSKRIGTLKRLMEQRLNPLPGGCDVRFNVPDGNVGLHALDKPSGPTIAFCDPVELDGYKVSTKGRHITRLAVAGAVRIAEWNDRLREIREKTADVVLTAYRGLRADGMYRRRLDWQLARGIIHNA